MQEVKRLEKVVASLKEVNDHLVAHQARMEGELQQLEAEREHIVPWVLGRLEMYPRDSDEAEVINQLAHDLGEQLASGFQ